MSIPHAKSKTNARLMAEAHLVPEPCTMCSFVIKPAADIRLMGNEVF